MLFITELLAVLDQGLNTTTFSATNLRHFAHIIESILSLSHTVTTRSVSRMSGLSYRTIQRFYALKQVNWTVINLLLFKHFVYRPGKNYLLAADETVVDKAGKNSYGIGHFYSSLARQVIRSVSFLVISIIDIEKEKSYVLGSNQLIHPTADKANTVKANTDKANTVKANTDKSTTPSKPTPSGRKGRPKGSKNKVKTEPESTSYQVLKTLLSLVQSQLKLFLPALDCFHLVLDGFYGHEQYLLLAATHQLRIISKLKTNAHLILPYQGPYCGVGRPKRLGDKVKMDKIDPQFYKYTLPETNQTNTSTSDTSTSDTSTSDTSTSDSVTKVYQFEAFTPKMSGIKLNIVVLIHLHLKTKKASRTILFSTDLTLDAPTLIHYYSLRFQIEFDFRDAKQFYGLSDFKNYKQTQLTNAANIAFTMSSIGKILLEKYRNKLGCPQMGIIDLKTVFRTCKWAKLLLNKDQLTVDEFLNNPNLMQIIRLEAIHL